MYFYTLSEGCYSDYSFVILYHKTKFTKAEFAKMFNEAVDNYTKNVGYDDVAEYLIEKYGFNKVEEELEIGANYGSYRKITEDDYEDDDFKYIDAEDKSWRNKY